MVNQKNNGNKARRSRSIPLLRNGNGQNPQDSGAQNRPRLGNPFRRAGAAIRRVLSRNELRASQDNNEQNANDQTAHSSTIPTPSTSTTVLAASSRGTHTPANASSSPEQIQGKSAADTPATNPGPASSTIRLVTSSWDADDKSGVEHVPAGQIPDESSDNSRNIDPVQEPNTPPRVVVLPTGRVVVLPSRTDTSNQPLSLEGFEWSPPPSPSSSPRSALNRDPEVAISIPPRVIVSPPDSSTAADPVPLGNVARGPPPPFSSASLSSSSASGHPWARISTNAPTIDVPDVFVPPAERMTASFEEETADVDQRASRAILQRPRSLQNILRQQREQAEK